MKVGCPADAEPRRQTLTLYPDTTLTLTLTLTGRLQTPYDEFAWPCGAIGAQNTTCSGGSAERTTSGSQSMRASNRRLCWCQRHRYAGQDASGGPHIV